MDRIVSDRAVKIIVLIIGIILVIDLMNVFIVGGPSVFSLIFKSGNAASASEISSGTIIKQTAIDESGSRNVGDLSMSAEAIYVPTKATPVATIAYVQEVTPIPKTTTTIRLFAPPPTQVSLEKEEYVLIYSKDLTYLPSNAPTAVAVNVIKPPLVIKFIVEPVMTSHVSVSINRSAKKSGPSSTDTLYNTTFPSENARFTATIYDKETGQKLDEDGYGGFYDQVVDNTFTVRKAGNYLVQFDGKQSTVHVEMELKKEGNII